MDLYAPDVTTGPSQGGSILNTLGGLLTDYAAGRAKIDLETRQDQLNTPDTVDHATAMTAAQTAQGVVANISPTQWVMLGVAGLLGVVLVVKLVK